MLRAESVKDHYAYVLSYWDTLADLERRYQLLFYVADNSIEMFDMKSRRVFLKRMVYPDLSLDDLIVGSVVNIHARQMKVEDYADDFTREKLGSALQSTLALVKPDAEDNVGHIIARANQEGLKVTKLKQVILSREDAEAFYAEHKGKPFFEYDFINSLNFLPLMLYR